MRFSKIIIPLLGLSLTSFVSLKAAELTRLPYLQLSTDSSQAIVWRTDGKVIPKVMIGKSVDKLSVANVQIFEKGAELLYKGSKSKQAKEGTLQYEAQLTKLEPNTIYYYAIYHGDERITPADKSYYFKTHPKPGTKTATRFWIVGDSGTGGADQIGVHEGLKKWLGNKKLDGYLHVGDMAYGSGTDPEFSQKFFSIYETTLRNVTCWSSMGNHEGKTSNGETGKGPYYDAYVLPTKAEAGGVPSGTEAYYSFDFGDVHFICLNSHDLDRRPTATMAKWLKADLEKTKAEWLIAFFHHPPYTKGSHDSDKEEQLIEMREHIMPILESGGVDAVFTGHSHIYERSMLIDGAYQTPSTNQGVVLDDGDGDPREGGDGSYRKSGGLTPNNGVIQVVAGNGGTTLRRKGKHVLMSKIILMHGSVIMETQGGELSLKMINSEGGEMDYCVLKKAGKVEKHIVQNPRAPELIEDPKNFKIKAQKLPKTYKTLIAKHAEWNYLAGGNLHPKKNWMSLDYDIKSENNWKKGKAGFGYSDKDDNTILDMKDKFSVVYTRKEFTIDDVSKLGDVGIAVKYDDGFIAYINGVQVVRSMVDFGSGVTAKGFHKHEAQDYEYFSFGRYRRLLKEGRNVIAIEGHNADLGSSDFTLDAFFLAPDKGAKK